MIRSKETDISSGQNIFPFLQNNQTLFNKDMQEKDAGHVRLINGMILPLDDKPILHIDPLKI